MKLSSSGLTHVGMKRSHNEDCLRIYRDQGLFIVADGMGGHASGEVASEMSVEALARFYTVSALDEELTWPFKQSYSETYMENRVRVGVQLSNRRIYESAVYDAKLKGMGTTIVTAAFYDDKFTVGHVGDSRVYHFRGDVLRQVTEDHSLLNDYIKMRPGGMTPEEIKAFPHKNVIVRALGMKENVQVDIITEQVIPGDLLLLCSDGLSGMLTDEEMHEMITHAVEESGGVGQVDLDDLCVALINGANRNGGNDNVTVILVRCDEVEGKSIEVKAPRVSAKPTWSKEEPSQPERSAADEPATAPEEEDMTMRGHFQVEPLLTPRSGAAPSKARSTSEPDQTEEPAEAQAVPTAESGEPSAPLVASATPNPFAPPASLTQAQPTSEPEPEEPQALSEASSFEDEQASSATEEPAVETPPAGDAPASEESTSAGDSAAPVEETEELVAQELAEVTVKAEVEPEVQVEPAQPQTLHGLPALDSLDELESMPTVSVTPGHELVDEETAEMTSPGALADEQDTINMLPPSSEEEADPLQGRDHTELTVSSVGAEGADAGEGDEEVKKGEGEEP